jgi:peptide-methionine (S)-S-oxide reductase
MISIRFPRRAALFAALFVATAVGCESGAHARSAAVPSPPAAVANDTAVLGGGCFWCLEAIFSELEGVAGVTPGYAGGHIDAPTYEQVCSGATGHAEVVEVRFDSSVISYRDLLRIYFTVHDPTTLNRQGPDVGTQYRSAVFIESDRQRDQAAEVLREIQAEKLWENEIVTEIQPLQEFFPAEEYHQRYFERNPDQAYCAVVIRPKVLKFREKFLERLRR